MNYRFGKRCTISKIQSTDQTVNRIQDILIKILNPLIGNLIQQDADPTPINLLPKWYGFDGPGIAQPSVQRLATGQISVSGVVCSLSPDKIRSIFSGDLIPDNNVSVNEKICSLPDWAAPSAVRMSALQRCWCFKDGNQFEGMCSVVVLPLIDGTPGMILGGVMGVTTNDKPDLVVCHMPIDFTYVL